MNTCLPLNIFDPDVEDASCMPTMLPDQKFHIFELNRSPRPALLALMSLGPIFRRVVHDAGRIAEFSHGTFLQSSECVVGPLAIIVVVYYVC